MKSCTACEADIPDDICICEHCAEIAKPSEAIPAAENEPAQEPVEEISAPSQTVLAIKKDESEPVQEPVEIVAPSKGTLAAKDEPEPKREEEITSPSDVESEVELEEQVGAESEPEIAPEPLQIAEPSEVESGFETVASEIVVPSDIEIEFKIASIGLVAPPDLEAEIDTVQIDISAASDIEERIDTVPMEIVAPPDLEARIDTVRVDSPRFAQNSFSAEELALEADLPYVPSNDNIEYAYKSPEGHSEQREDGTETGGEEEAEDRASAMPFMHYDDSSEKGLQAGIFAGPTPLYSDSGIMLAQSESDFPTAILDNEDNYQNNDQQNDNYPDEGEEGKSSLFVPSTLFYSGVQPAIQATIKASKASVEKAPLQTTSLRPRLSVMLLVLLTCLIILTSSGISILLVRAHSREVVPPVITLPQLKIKPQAFNLGQVTAGTKFILSTDIANTGKRAMNWYVDTGNLPWLKVNDKMAQGTISPGGTEQFIYTTVDASTLPVGKYSGEEDIHSNGGNTSIPIHMEVVSSAGKKAAKLNVDQSDINLVAQAGQQVTTSIAIGNVGNQSLSWQASVEKSTEDTSWLSLGAPSATTGTIPAGTFPGMLTITADATNLAPASYAARLAIRSNGGNAQINISFVVSATSTTVQPTATLPIRPTHPPLTPTPPPPLTPTPTPTPPTLPGWSVNPTSLNSGTCATTCTVTLTEDSASTGNITWSAQSDQIVGASFSPSSGTLSPNNSQQMVTISGMTCNNGNLTFSRSDGGPSITVPWTCNPTPTPPTWSVSPSALDSTCIPNCTVTLTEDAASTGTITWSASSDVNASFSPPNGTLSPGGQQVVTISGMTCNNGSFTFSRSDGVAPLTVTWACTATASPTPLLSVSPTSLSGCLSCTVTLTAQGALSWSTSSDLAGVTFSPPNGSFPNAGSIPVTITPNQTCPASGTFSFAGPANTFAVSWSCTGSTLTVGPTNFSPTGCSTSSTGDWQCVIMLTSDPNNQNTLNWTASTSGGSGIVLSQSGGSLAPGGSVQISVTIPTPNCPGTGQLVFTGPANTATSTWSC